MFHAPHQNSPLSNKLSKKLMGQIAFLDVALSTYRHDRRNLHALRQSIRCIQSIRATCHANRHSEMELLAGHLEELLTALRDNLRTADDESMGLLQMNYETLQAYAESVEFDGPLLDDSDGQPVDPMRQTSHVMSFAS